MTTLTRRSVNKQTRGHASQLICRLVNSQTSQLTEWMIRRLFNLPKCLKEN